MPPPEDELQELAGEVKQFTVDLKTLRTDSLQKFEEFKTENDKRVAALESKKAVDPLLEEKVEKIGREIITAQERFDQMSATVTRLNQTRLHGQPEETAKHARTFFQVCAARRNPAHLISDDEVDLAGYTDYKQALNHYLRKDEHVLSTDERKALQVGSDPDGGYLVNPEVSARIIDRVYETSPMRQLATVETIGTMSLEILVDIDEMNDGWVGETQARPETNTPQWRKKQIVVHELYAMPAATQAILDDASRDLEAWLMGKLSQRFARTEATAFMTGDGVGKPRGILTYPNGTAWGQVEQIPSGHATQLTSDGLVTLTFSLKEPFYANSTFLMNRTTIATVMKMKDGQNNYLWSPNFQTGQPSSLLGYPVRFANDMPAIGAGALAVAFGDFRESYTIVDRIGMRTLRDPYTSKPYVKFYTTRRVGGDVVNYESYKLQVVST